MKNKIDLSQFEEDRAYTLYMGEEPVKINFVPFFVHKMENEFNKKQRAALKIADKIKDLPRRLEEKEINQQMYDDQLEALNDDFEEIGITEIDIYDNRFRQLKAIFQANKIKYNKTFFEKECDPVKVLAVLGDIRDHFLNKGSKLNKKKVLL